MGLFNRGQTTPAQPTVTKEARIMQALAELSRANDGGFVSSLQICEQLGQNALDLGLSKALEGLEEQGLIEHHRFEDGTGGDRPTAAGLDHYGLTT